MKIRFCDIDTQLPGGILRRAPSHTIRDDATFWIVHPYETPTIWLEERLEIEDCRARGDAFLFISGNGLGGFGGASDGLKCAEELETEWNGRVHCLRPACSGRTNSVHQRIMLLLNEVEGLQAGTTIPWWIVQPATAHENLIAMYLVGLAVSYMDPSRRAAFVNRWAAVDPDWKQALLNNASVEYIAATNGKHIDSLLAADCIPVPEFLPLLREALAGHVGDARS